MFFIIVVLFIFLTLANILVLVKNLLKQGWTLFNYSLIYLIIFFNIIPVFSLLVPEEDIRYAYFVPDFTNNIGVLFFMLVIIALGFLFLNIGYSYKKRNKFHEKIRYRKIDNIYLKELLIFAILLLSLIGLYLYIRGFGSFEEAALSATAIRSGIYKSSSNPGDTSHTFFFRFIFLSILPFLYYFTLHQRRKYHKIMLILSALVLVVLYFFLSAGRQSIIDVFLIFIFSSLIIKEKVIDTKLIFFGFIALFSLPILTSYFTSNQSLSMEDVYFDFNKVFVNEFGFPFYSLFYAIVKDYNYFYFSDFVSGVFGTILPTSFAPSIEQTNILNTYYMTGEKGMGYVPPGFFAQGYYSLGVIGVLAISFFTGIFFKRIDCYFHDLMKVDKRYVFFYSYLIVQSLVWVRTTLPQNYFYNFTFLVFWFFIFMSFSQNPRKVIYDRT